MGCGKKVFCQREMVRLGVWAGIMLEYRGGEFWCEMPVVNLL